VACFRPGEFRVWLAAVNANRRMRDFTERGSYMSKYVPVRAALAGAAIIALAGCSASGSGPTPEVSRAFGTPTGTSTAAASSASRAASGTGATSGATANSFAAPASIPFPVAVGDTWLYQTTANINGARGTTTDKIVSAVPTAAGYQVTMSETIDAGGPVTTAEPVYIFYPNGTIGYPVTGANGVSVVGSGVRWPDAAGLASGRAYHSVLRIRVDQAGSSRYANANVTVQGAGTATVTVPAGTYQATVVDTTIATKVGGFTTTVEVKTWLMQGTGPVKSEVFTHAAGKTELITTEELLSFTKGAVRADGS
jgi:hypothetical protein